MTELQARRNHRELAGPQLMSKTELSELWRSQCEGFLGRLQDEIGHWRRDKGFRTDWYNVPEKLMLVVTELAEAMEAYRHLNSDSLRLLAGGNLRLLAGGMEPKEHPCIGEPNAALASIHGDLTVHVQAGWVLNFREELADTAIRLLDLCDALDIDLYDEICEKMAANEARDKKHGKEC